MRKVLMMMAIAASLSLTACASHSAYGPDSDERLDESISPSGGAASGDGAAILALNCNEEQGVLAALSNEADETKKLKGLGSVYLKVKDTFTKLDEGASSHTDMLYGKEGDQIKSNLVICRDTTAAAYSAFDRFVREVIDMPVVQEMDKKTRKMVNVARIDFPTLRKAIDLLEASDKEVLLNRLALVEPTLKAPEAEK